jgi:hypothetical protein
MVGECHEYIVCVIVERRLSSLYVPFARGIPKAVAACAVKRMDSLDGASKEKPKNIERGAKRRRAVSIQPTRNTLTMVVAELPCATNGEIALPRSSFILANAQKGAHWIESTTKVITSLETVVGLLTANRIKIGAHSK